MSSFGEIISNDVEIYGNGNLPLEDNIVINGISYNDVLHLFSDETISFKDVWIAPNVGVIKFKDQNGRTYKLVSYNIEKL